MKARSDCFVSVVAPITGKDRAVVANFVERTSSVLAEAFENWELILVDDGGGTAAFLRPIVSASPSTRLISLSRPFGSEIAMTAGLDAAIGDYVVTLTPATDPP